MALTLTVDEARWRAHLERAVAERPGLVPVVKGNGYGFGRPCLLGECARLGLTDVAVGTAWELAEVPTGHPGTVAVLTPCAHADVPALRAGAVPTVGSVHDLDVLAAGGWTGPVLVKLASSMRRYGTDPAELDTLLARTVGAGCRVHAFGIHFPLDSTSGAHAAEVASWLPRLPQGATVHVSHVDPADLDALAAGPNGTAAGRTLRPRAGTAIWLGDRGALHLTADVVAVRPIGAGEPAGYRCVPAPSAGHLVLVTAGTAHGVRPLDDGRSPFHFARTRLALLEPPHMHTSMLHVPGGDPCPAPGDVVDVQRPLTQTTVDRVRFA